MEVRTPKSLKDLIVRWENVERVLTGLSPHEKRKHFCMESWGFKTVCGTVACAAGHCGLDPWFRRRGLRLNIKAVWGNSSFGDDVWDFFVPYYESYGDSFDPMVDLAKEGVSIFYEGVDRPATKVIKEVRAFLRRLRKAEKEGNPSRQGGV